MSRPGKGQGVRVRRRVALCSGAALAALLAIWSAPAQAMPATVTGHVGIRLVPAAQLPYIGGALMAASDPGPFDAAGVRMILRDGRLYDYPGGQARYGLACLNDYRLTGDTEYLDGARAQAARLAAIHLDSQGAWYFPQYYSRERHNTPGDMMLPPWYSGMAQGQALSLFVRLYEATGEASYLEAARATLISFVFPGPAAGPWTVTIDAADHLWIQEWPKVPLDCTFNGHMISAYGLYDYYRVTGDQLASSLFCSAAATTLDYAPRFRRAGWVSKYCLRHASPNTKYHQIHIQCLLKLYTLTGDAAFARYADLFTSDYPKPDAEGTVRVSRGTYRLARFDASQKLCATRRVSVTADTTVTCSRRQRIGGVIRLLVSTGPWTGLWLREQPSRVYLLGKAAVERYEPARRVTLQARRRYIGKQYADDGQVTAVLAAVASGAAAHVSERAVVNGRGRVLVTDGQWKGFWLPVADVRLR